MAQETSFTFVLQPVLYSDGLNWMRQGEKMFGIGLKKRIQTINPSPRGVLNSNELVMMYHNDARYCVVYSSFVYARHCSSGDS